MVREELVVESTRRPIEVTITDEKDVPVNLTGASQPPRIQGKSSTGTPDINAVGTVIDAPNGLVRFSSVGNYVTAANLTAAGVTEATYSLRIHWWDSAGKDDYGDIFEVTWVKKPI